MSDIRSVSDLRNKFTEIENAVQGENPVYLTKNRYGAMVVLSIEKYSELTDNTDYIEAKLNEADQYAKSNG